MLLTSGLDRKRLALTASQSGLEGCRWNGSLGVLARRVTSIASSAASALLASAASARGAETTLTFVDLAANTTVSTQYAGRGVTFGPSVSGQTQVIRSLPVVANVGTTAGLGRERRPRAAHLLQP